MLDLLLCADVPLEVFHAPAAGLALEEGVPAVGVGVLDARLGAEGWPPFGVGVLDARLEAEAWLLALDLLEVDHNDPVLLAPLDDDAVLAVDELLAVELLRLGMGHGLEADAVDRGGSA